MLMIRPERLRPHHDADCLAHLEKPREVHRQDTVPLRTRKLIDRHPMRQRVDAGVVDENIDSAKLRDDLLHRGVNVGDFRDIQGHADAPRRLCRRGDGTGAIDIGEDDAAAIGGKTIGDRLPDAARRTGDDTDCF